MNKPTKVIPKFDTEAQQRAYWETHDSTEHLDWTKAKSVTLPILKPTSRTISLRRPHKDATGRLAEGVDALVSERESPHRGD